MMRRPVVFALAFIAADCRPIPTPQPAAASPPGATVLAVTVPGEAPDVLAPRVVALFEAHGLPVTSNQGGVVTAALPPYAGRAYRYATTARAVVAVASPAGSAVTLRADETTLLEHDRPGATVPIGPGSRGRAGDVWRALVAVRDSLAAMR